MSIYQGNKMISGRGTNGISPVIDVISGDGEHVVSVTDATGVQSFTITDGTDGDDGFSPVISIMNNGNEHTVTVTDATGSQVFVVRDGFSPSRYPVTLNAAGWTAGSDYSYTQTADIPMVSADVDFDYDCQLTGSNETTDLSILEAFAMVTYADSISGGIVFKATGLPSVDIPVMVRLYL